MVENDFTEFLLGFMGWNRIEEWVAVVAKERADFDEYGN